MPRHTSKKYALFLITVSLRIGQNQAFALLTQNSSLLHSTFQNRLPYLNKRRLLSTNLALSHNPSSQDDDDHDSDDDISLTETIQHARQRLEDMISIPQEKQQTQQPSLQHQTPTPPSRTVAYLTHQINSMNTPGTYSSPLPPPPLTTIARERHISELEILNSLSTSDDAINDLWKLWFMERGSDAARLLRRAEELSSRVLRASGHKSSAGSGASGTTENGEEYAQEAEDLLWDLIEEHGVHWAEPVNRLATLMYMRGRLEESKALCEVVLNVKPWHIGALNGMVMVCISMNDVGGAREWAEKRLPTLVIGGESGGNDMMCSRRRSWVKRACHDAKHRYDLAAKYERGLEKEEAQFHHMRKILQKIVQVNQTNQAHEQVNNDKLCGENGGVWQ